MIQSILARSFGKKVYAAFLAFVVGSLYFSAPGGGWLVSDPPKERVSADPSVRAGSAGRRTFWLFSGGYHGGK